VKLHGDPAHCFAVLVGIECYGRGISGLAGPAMDALRLADWLLRQGVPGARLRLFINQQPIADASQSERREALRRRLAAAGAEFAEPLRHLIDAALAPKNLPLHDGIDDAILLLYFSGHGVCAQDSDARLAITADASADCAEAINLEQHAARLRLDRHSRRFAQQWLILDACGQVMDDALLAYYQPNRPRSSDYDKGGAEQYCLCSALPGEYSQTRPLRQESLFTAALLQRLENRALRGLDLELLFRELDDQFSATAQHPSLWRRNERRECLWRTPHRATVSAIIRLIEQVGGLRSYTALLLAIHAGLNAAGAAPARAGRAPERDPRPHDAAAPHDADSPEALALRLSDCCSALAQDLLHTALAERIELAADLSDAAVRLRTWRMRAPDKHTARNA
jgi:hypothetical protein